MLTIGFIACFFFTGYSQGAIHKKSDTLSVAYTYWWPSGGPFIGLCGDRYSLVFTGTITKINNPQKPHTINSDTAFVLYTPQYGIIKIDDIKVENAPEEGNSKQPGKKYSGEQYFKSDCFYQLKLKEGDKVMVFVYSYEGEYCIPGNSILKINSFDDPIVLSVEKYIKNNQDPLAIQPDIKLWRKYGFESALKQIIDCRLSIKNGK